MFSADSIFLTFASYRPYSVFTIALLIFTAFDRWVKFHKWASCYVEGGGKAAIYDEVTVV